ENPLNENNTTYVRLTAQAGGNLSNSCYSGFAVHQGESFNASIFARGSYDGKITVSIVDGDKTLGRVSFDNITEEFAKYSGIIETEGEASAATVKVTIDSGGTVDMDMISVMSRDTYNGRDNGLRKDIVKKLTDLHPGFVRFPGGCVAEGYYLDNRYNWKDSVGPVERRKENWNRWQTGSNAYDYCQTYGLGFYEYFLLCEDIGAKPLPVVSVGIGCQYQSGEVSSWDELYSIYIQDTLDLIEFANGDPETSEWAKIRADMGHPEPFNLEYIGIGNEQWNTETNRFFERYEAFEEEIHKLYPDIKLISTSGPSADGTHFVNAWSWLETHNGDEDFTYAVDEHYYKTPEWFLANSNRYDSYDRNGFSVFAGEYAANGTYKNTLYSAIAEAAYMTGLERNADIVRLASYAPLLAKEGYTQWTPDLIWFNNTDVYGSPDYWVQYMYSNNNGSYTLENELLLNGRTAEKKMSVKANYEPQSANSAANLIDGSSDTRWSVDKYGSYAVVDLGSVTDISGVSVSFMAKENRKYYYTLETSVDGESYTTVFDGESKVNSSAAHFTEVNAEVRYIRLTSKGSS
ncbi:MAG: alpha-L-arabinofuranosidase C-terminal domain-containing protein, partial [Clostridia bacterium]